MDNKTFRKTLAERLNASPKDVDSLISALKVLMAECAQNLCALAIPGFGTFVPVKHDEAVVTDLSSGKRMLLPPEICLEFYPGSAFRKKVDPQAPLREIDTLPAGGTMNLPTAADSLAGINSISRDAAEAFLKEFFALVEEEDSHSGAILIKGLGEFRGLQFKPDADLAEEVNQPFAMFEPVELDDSLSEEELYEPLTDDAAPATDEIVEEEEPEEEETSSQNEAEYSEPGEEEEPVEDEPEPEIEAPAPAPVHCPDTADSYDRPTEGISMRTFCIALFVTVAAALVTGFLIGRVTAPVVEKETILIDTVVNTVHDTVRIAQETPPSVKEPAKPKADPIYDTVTPTRYLASMSRQYYGRMEYWVYIYKANEGKLGNPDKIKPGTRVEIPPFERYATSTNDSINLARARRMSDEIYSRYKK